jgi:hypothetical protein
VLPGLRGGPAPVQGIEQAPELRRGHLRESPPALSTYEPTARQLPLPPITSTSQPKPRDDSVTRQMTQSKAVLRNRQTSLIPPLALDNLHLSSVRISRGAASLVRKLIFALIVYGVAE